MGKRKRHNSTRTWWIAAGVTAAVIATGAVSAAALTRHTTDTQAITSATERIEAAAAERRAQEAAAVQAAVDARTTTVSFPTDRPLNVAFLGDSLSNGSYTSTPELGWTGQITSALRVNGAVNPTTAATSGQTVGDALRRTIPAGQDLVLIELGTNDVGTNVDLAAFDTTYRQYLAAVKAASPEADMICITPWNTAQRSDDYTDLIEAACGEMAAPVVDIARVYSTPTTRAHIGDTYFGGAVPDDAHPNDLGHTQIAKAIMQWVQFA